MDKSDGISICKPVFELSAWQQLWVLVCVNHMMPSPAAEGRAEWRREEGNARTWSSRILSMHRLAPKAARAASATSRSLSTTTPARLSATAPALSLNPNAPDVPDFAQKKRERKRAVPGKVPDKNVGKDARKHAFHPSPHAPAKAPIFQEWHVPEAALAFLSAGLRARRRGHGVHPQHEHRRADPQ